MKRIVIFAAALVACVCVSCGPASETVPVRKYEELPPCVESLKKEGLIKEYNRYASLSNPDEYVLIIYNRKGEIEAILGEGPERINMRTLQTDGVANYKGRGAIGVKLTK